MMNDTALKYTWYYIVILIILHAIICAHLLNWVQMGVQLLINIFSLFIFWISYLFVISNIIRSQLCICILKNYHNWQNKQKRDAKVFIERGKYRNIDHYKRESWFGFQRKQPEVRYRHCFSLLAAFENISKTVCNKFHMWSRGVY